MTEIIRRWSTAASLMAGVLWLLVWFHQRVTHGPTALNEMRLLFGLTWMDSAKFLALVPVLLLLGGAGLYQRLTRRGLLGRSGGIVAGVGLALLSLGIALEFWGFPWGSYAVGFEQVPLSQIGGQIQASSSLVFTIGLMTFSIELVRRKEVPIWAPPVWILGGLTTFFLTPASWLPGAAWLLLGGILHKRRNV